MIARIDASLLSLLLVASVLTPCRTTQCHVVTIFGLKTADCNKQNIRVIPQSLDRDLQVMRFDDNRVKSLDADAFRIYPNLQEIYLARNRIGFVAPRAFSGLFSLQILDLEDNRLTVVPSESFRLIPSLRMLSLKANPIRRIDAESLAGLRNIEELNFESCHLDDIAPSAFRGLTRLVEVNLVNNELQGLDPETVVSLPASLNVLRLYRNPWTCNCRLRWLRRWISASGDVINWDFATNTPTCAAPELIKGVAWKHLTADQFACPSRIVFNATRTSVTVERGRNVTLQCTAVGDPEPTVAWMRDGGRTLPPGAATVEKRGLAPSAERQVSNSVTLVTIGPSDAGDYLCVAENSAGRSEMTFKVQVEAVPGALESESPDSGRGEIVLGILLGIGILVVVVVMMIVVNRLKRRHQQKKRNFNCGYYAKNPTPMTRRREDEGTGQEEGDEEEEEEEESGGEKVDDSDRRRAGSANRIADPTLRSLLGGQKCSDLDILKNHRDEETVERRTNRSKETKDQNRFGNQTNKQTAKDRREEVDDYEVFGGSRRINRKRSRDAFEDEETVPPLSPPSEYSVKSSIPSEAVGAYAEGRQPPTPDLINVEREGGGRHLPVNAQVDCWQPPEALRSGRMVSFEVVLQPSQINGQEMLSSGRKETSSSAETLAIDDIAAERKQQTTDSEADARQRSVETGGSGLSRDSVALLSDASPKYEKNPVKSSVVETTTRQGLQMASKSCLRRNPFLSKETGFQGARKPEGNLDSNWDEEDRGGLKFVSVEKRGEHRRQLPRTPPIASTIIDSSNRGSIQGTRQPRGERSTSDDDDDGGRPLVDLPTQRTSTVRTSSGGGPLSPCHSIDRIPFYAHQSGDGSGLGSGTDWSTRANVSAFGQSLSIGHSKLLRHAVPARFFDTLPGVPVRRRGQRSDRPEEDPVTEFVVRDRQYEMSAVSLQRHPRLLNQQKQRQQQQQQQHVTLLSDILLPPFGGKESAPLTTADESRIIRTKDDARRRRRRNGGSNDDDDDDDEDDEGTPL